MAYGTADFALGDRVRFAGRPDEPDAASTQRALEGEVVGINREVSTVDVTVVIGGRPSLVTKRPWDLEPIRRDSQPDRALLREL